MNASLTLSIFLSIQRVMNLSLFPGDFFIESEISRWSFVVRMTLAAARKIRVRSFRIYNRYDELQMFDVDAAETSGTASKILCDDEQLLITNAQFC